MPLRRSRLPSATMLRPRRGMRALSICWVVRPLPALAGTVPGMVQLPPPVLLRAAPRLAPCEADRLAFVQPMDSKPVVLTLFVAQATPASTPKVLSQVLLTRAEPRLPHLS